MDPLYKPEGVEERWQRTWEDEGLYNAEPDSGRETFVVAHPPPNVTGALHTGHALQISLADALVRWHRMRDFETAFQPGYDHAGISTQNAVEKHLVEQGTSRQEVGRERFVEIVWEWLREYGGTIMGQFRRMGASLDYRRERFTMDDDYIRAVMRFFVHLYRKGWIYRANRIINWCPFHETSLSDLELVHEEVDDTLTYVRYPFADDVDDGVTIATVRPATILADVAVAVHPDDERYSAAVGREVVVPFVERRVPVIADERVEPGVRHRRAQGHARARPDRLRDRPRARPARADRDRPGRPHERGGRRARRADAGRGRGADPRVAQGARPAREARAVPALGRALRALQEPDRAADLAAVVVRDGRAQAAGARGAARAAASATTRESQHRFAIDSLENAPDWNISRQLWWGHQLPVWYCPDGHVTVAETEPEACAECGSTELTRDADVLDTWFSSALWPFATLGWPDETPELEAFYPGSLNTTAREIIRLWENRMIFSGLELMGEIPFSDVIIHTTVLGRGRAADVEEPRHRPRPARGGRPARRGRDPLRPAEDLLHAGRALLRRRDRGGPQAREQALERVAADPRERRRGRGRSSGRQTLEERWILARLDAGPAQVEEQLAALRLLAGDERALPPHLRRLLRLVRRGDQAAALRRRRGRAGDRARGARAAAEAAPSGDAARDRGDLVEPARRARRG